MWRVGMKSCTSGFLAKSTSLLVVVWTGYMSVSGRIIRTHRWTRTYVIERLSHTNSGACLDFGHPLKCRKWQRTVTYYPFPTIYLGRQFLAFKYLQVTQELRRYKSAAEKVCISTSPESGG